jgi:iron-sulfur cluster insertion protein
MITMTEAAGVKVKNLLETENKQNYGLRVSVSGGGCHGFQYGMSFEEKTSEDDHILEYHGVKLFLDPQSAMLLNEAVVDYVEGLEGAGFAIKNPQAKSTCGCGHSFSA